MMWFFSRNEEEKIKNFQKPFKEETTIDLLEAKICQLQDDLSDLHKLHTCLANEHIALSGVVSCLHTHGTEAKEFIEQFREMILVGHRLLGYENSETPKIWGIKPPAETKKPKKKKCASTSKSTKKQ